MGIMNERLRDYLTAGVLAVLFAAIFVGATVFIFLPRPYDVWVLALTALLCAALALTLLIALAGKPIVSALRAYWQQSKDAQSSRPKAD